MILQEVRENELFVQRLHQRLAIHGGHRADDRRVLEFLLVGCKGQDHRRAGHNNDILLGFIRSGKENVKLIGGRLGGWTPEFDILREAGAHLAAVALVADQKETPNAASQQCVCKPSEKGRAHDVLQHRRAKISCFCSIIRNKHDGGQSSQIDHNLSTAHNRFYYSRLRRICIGIYRKKSAKAAPIIELHTKELVV